MGHTYFVLKLTNLSRRKMGKFYSKSISTHRNRLVQTSTFYFDRFKFQKKIISSPIRITTNKKTLFMRDLSSSDSTNSHLVLMSTLVQQFLEHRVYALSPFPIVHFQEILRRRNSCRFQNNYFTTSVTENKMWSYTLGKVTYLF